MMSLLAVVLISIGLIYALSSRESFILKRIGSRRKSYERDLGMPVPEESLPQAAKEAEEAGELDSGGIRVE